MFLPLLPHIGIDTDSVVLMGQQDIAEPKAVEKKETAEQRMRKELRQFAVDLIQANTAWAEWGIEHPDEIPDYRRWFKSASMLRNHVIPSMAFDFAMMPNEAVVTRFDLIKQSVTRLLFATPSKVDGM